MATLYITEYAKQSGVGLTEVPVAQLPAVTTQTVTVTGTSAQSAVLNEKTTLIRLQSDANCHIASSTNPTATTSNTPLNLGMPEYFGVPAGSGLKIAAILGA